MFEIKTQAISPKAVNAAEGAVLDSKYLKGALITSVEQFKALNPYRKETPLAQTLEEVNSANRTVVARLFAALQGFEIKRQYSAIREDYNVAYGEESRLHDNGAAKKVTHVSCQQGVNFYVQETHNCESYRITLHGAVGTNLANTTYLIRAVDIPALIAQNLEKPGIPYDRKAYFTSCAAEEKAKLSQQSSLDVAKGYLTIIEEAGQMLSKARLDRDRAYLWRNEENLIKAEGASAFESAADIRMLAKLSAYTYSLSERFDEIFNDALANRIEVVRDVSRRPLKLLKERGNLLQKFAGWLSARKVESWNAENLKKFFLAVYKQALASPVSRAGLACLLLGQEKKKAEEAPLP